MYAASDKLLVVADENGGGTVYNLETGKPLGHFPDKYRFVAMDLSRDGRWLVTGDQGHAVRVWDVRTRKLARTLYEHSGKVIAVAISADGDRCASYAWRNRVWVFDREDGTCLARTDSVFYVNARADFYFSPDNKTLIGAGAGIHHGLFVWDWTVSREMRGGRHPKGDGGFGDEEDLGKASKWNLNGFGPTSMAADGTLLCEWSDSRKAGVCDLRLWDGKPRKPPPPPPSPEPPAPKPPPRRPGR